MAIGTSIESVFARKDPSAPRKNVLPHQNTEGVATRRLVTRKSNRYSGSIPWRNPP